MYTEVRANKMKFILKILAFTALLLISKFTKEEEQQNAAADSPGGIISAKQTVAQIPPPVLVSGNLHHEPELPKEPVQTLVATPATVK